MEVVHVRNLIPLSHELLIAGLVRDWTEEVLPGETAAADRAVGIALRSYAGGASVSEACREARRFVGSWARHPSHQPVGAGTLRRLAS